MRVAVKIGTSTLTHRTGRLNIRRVESLCKVLSDLKNAGQEIVLISSGAIGMGVGKMNLPKRPDEVDLLPYHDIGKGKHERMWTTYNPEGLSLSAPSKEDQQRCLAQFEAHGIKAKIGG